jgi:predicted transcriptional regulator
MDIAEVLLGGLVYEVKTNGSSNDPDDLQFEFVEGVRDALAATRPVTEQIQVLQAISDYIAEQTGKPSGFRALLAAAAAGSDPSFIVTEESRPFAMLSARLLRKLGR